MEPTPEDIAAQWRAIRARVDAAARRAGRDPSGVRVVAVTKVKPAWMVDAAAAAGATVFGENYVQEALAKRPEVRASGIEWHLIGKLQTNKAKHAVGAFALLHAVDSSRLVRELDRRASAAGIERVDVLLEVNVAGEQTKAGVPAADAARLLEEVRDAARVRFRGLMAMPPPGDGGTNRPWFAKVAALGAELRERGALPPDATELSMGTTSDFEAAVEEGATLVRVGTAIFGARPKKQQPGEDG